MGTSKKYKKNEDFKLLITDIGTNGEGIGHLEDGYTLFVQGTVPGDTVLAHIIKAQKNYGIAKAAKILEESPDRIKPECPNADRCGGCQISQLAYEKQLELKEHKVRELLARVGGFDKELINRCFHPIVGFYDRKENGIYEHSLAVNTPTRFRNKAQYPVGTDREGKLITGFYSSHSHRIVPTSDCLIGAETDAPILKCIIKYMEDYHITAYDEEEHKGLIRHILIRTGYYTGEIMVCLVINGSDIPEKQSLISGLTKIDFASCGSNMHSVDYHISSICISANTEDTNVIMGDSYRPLWGNEYITDKIGDVSFRISPLSFFQVNPIQTQKLYELALDAAELTGNEVVWDLYCGIGTISLFLAQKAREVYGVEVVPQAIENAVQNAELNGISNAHFCVGKAEEILPAYYNGTDSQIFIGIDKPSENAMRPDVIVIDPPRKGCDADCLMTMLQMAPERIVYVSCDPATLARDLKYLCEDNKYELKSVTPVDMFSNSCHVETVVKLAKRRG